MSPVLFECLDREWSTLGTGTSARRRLRRWATTEPLLGCFDHPAHAVEFAHRRNQPAESDAVLVALVRLAADDPVAGRTLLQALLPGLRAVAVSVAWTGEPDEVDAQVIAHAWELICRYPIERRPSRIAANVVLDVRKRVLRDFRRRARERLAEETAAARAAPDAPVARTAAEEVLQALVDGVRCERLTVGDANLVAQTRLGGIATEEISLDADRRRALRRQRIRAERRLVNGRTT